MNTVRVDILDALGVPQGYGPLFNVVSTRVVRALDGAGSISLTFPGTEERAIELIENERRARAYLTKDNGDIRYIGGGVLRSVDVSASQGGWTLKADGPDMLDDLKRVNTLLRREFKEVTLGSVVEALAAMAGWTATVDPAIASQLITVRFDGESILKALQSLASSYGLHLREGETANTIEFGAFGTAIDLVLMQPRGMDFGAYNNSAVAIINRISVKRDTASLVNWLVPVGGGEGLAALTLQHSTRVSPYTIQSTVGPDGNLIYYLSDAASIASYGQVQKVGLFKEITPIDNTDAGIQIAANALYDAAAAYLERYSQKLVTYKLSVTKLDAHVRPGDKVRLVYRGLVYNDQNEPVDFLSVNEELWVMKVTENFSHNGSTVDLEVSTVDRYEMDTVKIVVGAIESMQLRNLRIQPYPTTMAYVYRREIDPTHNANIPIDISNGTLYLDRCRIRVVTRPFRTTVAGAEAASAVVGTTSTSPAVAATSSAGGSSTPTSAAGGDHSHRMFQHSNFQTTPSFWRKMFGRASAGGSTLDVVFGMNNNVTTNDLYTYDASGNHTHDITIPSHTHSVTLPAHDHDVTIPAHTHALDYGILDDSQYPDTLSIWINGIDRTAALGGPWAVGGGALNQVLDIDEYINLNLRQLHSVEFRCTGGQGDVEVTVELKITVQSLQQV